MIPADLHNVPPVYFVLPLMYHSYSHVKQHIQCLVVYELYLAPIKQY